MGVQANHSSRERGWLTQNLLAKAAMYTNQDFHQQSVDRAVNGLPDYKPIFARAQGADPARCAQAEAELLDTLEDVAAKVKQGGLLGCLCCPCTCGCSCICCPICCTATTVPQLQEWSDKYPLIALEVNKYYAESGGPSKPGNLQVPPPSLQAVNARRAELGLPPSQG